MLVEFECPVCKGHVCKRWALNSPDAGIRFMYWHMILNPGLAFNELFLGQREPSELHECQSCALPMVDRSYVHCPSCDTFHSGRIWSYRNAFGNWLGLVCPKCGGDIPCLWNLTSRLILAVTAPIWWIPVKRYRFKLQQAQRLRIAQSQSGYIDPANGAAKKINYVQLGLLWGSFMFGYLVLIAPLIMLVGKGELNWSSYIGLVMHSIDAAVKACVLGGLGFALVMRLMLQRMGDPSRHLTYDADGILAQMDEDFIETKPAPNCGLESGFACDSASDSQSPPRSQSQSQSQSQSSPPKDDPAV